MIERQLFRASRHGKALRKERLEGEMQLAWRELARVKLNRFSLTHPIIRSYCCCLIFGETLQSTWPVLNVMAKASAISFWMAAGIVSFLFAGPTHTSVAPTCSNSLAPSCVISAPDTSESTTFVGNLCSRCDSTPRVFVVLTRMQVC